MGYCEDNYMTVERHFFNGKNHIQLGNTYEGFKESMETWTLPLSGIHPQQTILKQVQAICNVFGETDFPCFSLSSLICFFIFPQMNNDFLEKRAGEWYVDNFWGPKGRTEEHVR